MMWIRRMAAVIGTLLALDGAARANPISTLYSTGVDAMGNLLADGSVDPHYQLTAVPKGASSILTTDIVAANPYWPRASDSAYISPFGGTNNAPSGVYVYSTTFSLIGMDPTTASINGRLSGDDKVYISLNSGSFMPTSATWTTMAAFSITSGFISGLNTLTFAVQNDGGATGLIVSQAGTATAVPEPAALSVMLVGGIALCLVTRRRRSLVRGVCPTPATEPLRDNAAQLSR